MINNGTDFLADATVIDVPLFSLDDPDLLMKYKALSGIWSKLIQLKLATINIRNNEVSICLFTYAQDSDVILNTYMDEVRNVFKNI